MTSIRLNRQLRDFKAFMTRSGNNKRMNGEDFLPARGRAYRLQLERRPMSATLRKFLLIERPPYDRAVAEARAGMSLDLAHDVDPVAAFRALGRFPATCNTVLAAALFSRACFATIGIRPRVEQIACGIVMARGAIAEMDTGEGKTVASAFAACLLALSGDGVHSVTVNPYLAERDHELLSPLYASLGFTSALLRPCMGVGERKVAYAADIVHGTCSEFVFDRLRDGVALSSHDIVQRGHAAAVVDEADSVLLDEASTPLVLSDGTGTVSEAASFCDRLVAGLAEGDDYEVDSENGLAHLTAEAVDRAEAALRGAGHLPRSATLYDGRTDIVGHLTASMKARLTLVRDRDYIVRDGKVEIVDANTGRVLDGRRYADGLHEAVEIKEGVAHSGSGNTVSSTTYMNYFGLYRVLCGATGTAVSSSSEIRKLYRVPTVRIPAHRPSQRLDFADSIHDTLAKKHAAVVSEALAMHTQGRPVLICTGSVAESVEIARLVELAGCSPRADNAPVPRTYALLNASNSAHEAQVVASAGRLNALTVATNMAGRGTDILTGGGDTCERDAVLALGGLHVIGVGRHGSKRIDDQLRGRAGRRGEPGSTRFHVSLEDDVIVRHAASNIDTLRRLRAASGDAELRRIVDQAQRVAEAAGADMREALWQYAAVDAVQNDAFHSLRRAFMETPDPAGAFREMRSASVARAVAEFMPSGTYVEQWDIPALRSAVVAATAIDFPLSDWAIEDGTDGDTVLERILSALSQPPIDEMLLKTTVLSAFDACWREHVARLEILRRAVTFRTYAFLQPVTEYRVESFPMFAKLLDTLNDRASAAVSWMTR